jgi:hypothetical protein
MRVYRIRGGVGEWFFEDSRQFPTRGREKFEATIDCCQRVALVLEEFKLLIPCEVVFFGWNKGEEPDPSVMVAYSKHRDRAV